MLDVGEKPVAGAGRTAELHRLGEAVVAHVAPDPHVGHTEALAQLADSQIASVGRNLDMTFDSRNSTHRAAPSKEAAPINLRSRGTGLRLHQPLASGAGLAVSGTLNVQVAQPDTMVLRN